MVKCIDARFRHYGYFNTSILNGSAGWSTSEPQPGEGLLYQWSAAMKGSITERAQGVCPTGWHIPSDCEWMYLEHGLGMSLSEQLVSDNHRSNTTDNQGTPGYKMRNAGTGQTNASGFSGALVGFRRTNGIYSNRSFYGYWWSSTATGTFTAINRAVGSGLRGVTRYNSSKGGGFSVRCLKD